MAMETIAARPIAVHPTAVQTTTLTMDLQTVVHPIAALLIMVLPTVVLPTVALPTVTTVQMGRRAQKNATAVIDADVHQENARTKLIDRCGLIANLSTDDSIL